MNTKILIVEDDIDIRKNLKLLLESEGYSVDLAENGHAALDHLSITKNLPAVIVLDLMMPVMDGFQFRERQELDPRLRGIPVLIVTAGSRLEESKLKMGAMAAMRKPIDAEEFLRVVKQLC